jgi:hypothetical protein
VVAQEDVIQIVPLDVQPHVLEHVKQTVEDVVLHVRELVQAVAQELVILDVNYIVPMVVLTNVLLVAPVCALMIVRERVLHLVIKLAI